MILSVVTPATQLITTVDAKNHLRVTGSSEDAYIDTLVGAATNAIETHIEGQIGAATFKLETSSFNDINLPKHPVNTITSIEYYDSSNSLQTLATSFYNLFKDLSKSVLEYGDNLPDVYDRTDAVAIKFTCGYGTLPDALKQSILIVLGSLYENREDKIKKLPSASEHLSAPYKRYYL